MPSNAMSYSNWMSKFYLIICILIFLPVLVPSEGFAEGKTTRVSVSSTNEEGNDYSDYQSISSDGRYVAFESYADNLVAGDSNDSVDIFIHDRQTGQTTMVSISTDGVPGNSNSYWPSISSDGRYVAFSSWAENLVAVDTNSAEDVFVRDRQTGQTTMASISTGGVQGKNGSSKPSISSDGRYVAFESDADNLVAGDSNVSVDIFVHDRQTGQTTMASVSTGGVQGNYDSYWPSISSDGRYVAFSSDANNLVAGDTNSSEDVFVRDRQTGQTTRVSVSSLGMQGNFDSSSPSISSDGRYVAFSSNAANLVDGDTNDSVDIFVHDRQTAQTTLESVASSGVPGNENSYWPSISSSGRYVAFESEANNLVVGDTDNRTDVFMHDRQTDQTTRVSVSSSGVPGNENSYWPSISSDGRHVAFWSSSDNLVTGDTNNKADVFVHDRQPESAGLNSPYVLLILLGD